MKRYIVIERPEYKSLAQLTILNEILYDHTQEEVKQLIDSWLKSLSDSNIITTAFKVEIREHIIDLLPSKIPIIKLTNENYIIVVNYESSLVKITIKENSTILKIQKEL